MLKTGIKQKLILNLVITTLVLMSLFFLLLDQYLKDYSRSEAEKTILFLGQNASSLLQRPLFYQDYGRLTTIAQSIRLENFDYLVVIDNTTTTIAFKNDENDITSSFDWEKTVKGKEIISEKILNIKNQRFTQYLFPIFAGTQQPLGFLVIGVSVEKMESRLRGITKRILVISAFLFLSLTLTIYLLAEKIARPLRILTEKIATFASGDYSVRSHIKTSDEIRDLSDNFNFMADKINEQIVSIEEYSKNLENMVEERTQELLVALDAIKEKDKKLTQVEKVRSLNTLVSSIAHEINNPLAIISGNIQLMENRIQDTVLIKKIRSAADAVERIANLIDEMTFFSAIRDISYSPIIFAHLVDKVIKRIVPRTVSVHIDGSEDEQFQSNQYLLGVCLENILENSIDAFKTSGIRGEIYIKYWKEGDYFWIEIEDNGGGFADLSKIFEPFYTTYNNKKGLGLTFVYHVVQTLNGEVMVDNTEKGAQVRLMLPIDSSENKTNDG